VELQRRVVRDHGIGREPARQEIRVDREVLRAGAAGHDGVKAAPDVQEMSGAHVLPQDRLACHGLARGTLPVRGSEVLKPEQGMRSETVQRPHDACRYSSDQT
jgi:hypothetical protein